MITSVAVNDGWFLKLIAKRRTYQHNYKECHFLLPVRRQEFAEREKHTFPYFSTLQTSLSRVRFLVQWTGDPGWQLLKSFISILPRGPFVVRRNHSTAKEEGSGFETKEATYFAFLGEVLIHTKPDVLSVRGQVLRTRSSEMRSGVVWWGSTDVS
jgi:hypothetical protein